MPLCIGDRLRTPLGAGYVIAAWCPGARVRIAKAPSERIELKYIIRLPTAMAWAAAAMSERKVTR